MGGVGGRVRGRPRFLLGASGISSTFEVGDNARFFGLPRPRFVAVDGWVSIARAGPASAGRPLGRCERRYNSSLCAHSTVPSSKVQYSALPNPQLYVYRQIARL